MEERLSILNILSFFFKKHKLKAATVVILAFIVGGLEAASVVVVYPILNTAFEGGVGQEGGVLMVFARIVELLPISDVFLSYCLLFILLALLAFIIKLFYIRYRLIFTGRLVENNQKEIFGKYIQADFQYFAEHKQGELVYNAISAPQGIRNFFNAVTELLAQAVLSISIFVLLFSLSWQGMIVVLVMGLIYYFFTRFLADRIAYDAGKHQAEAISESTVIINETIDGIKQVKVFGVVNEWVKRFGNMVRIHWHHYIRQSTWQQALQPALTLLLYVSVGVTAASIRLIAPNSFSTLIPVFGTFAFAVFRLIPILGGITNATMMINSSMPNCERIYRVLTTNIRTIEDGSKELDSFTEKVEFDGITFAYKGRDNVIENFTVAFEKGKTSAIVGRSGSGKTTVVNLLLRLYDVDRGMVKIDGLDIKDIKLASWLDKIGYVSQDTFIFNDTIKNNITFGLQFSEEEVIRVAKYANAHDFITEFPDGYDTLVGDRGIKLSGGQRQRIAVARAMIRNPEVLIFDEATNALDNISEAAVQKSIDETSKSHTVIIIAHRLSTIVNADKIIVLGGGRILEEGTHKELLEKKAAYWELYQNQPMAT